MADDLRAGFQAYKASNPELANIPDLDLARQLYADFYTNDKRFKSRDDFLTQLGFDTSLPAAVAEGGIRTAEGLGALADQAYRGFKKDVLGQEITPETSLPVNRIVGAVPFVGPALSGVIPQGTTVKTALEQTKKLKEEELRYANPNINERGLTDWSNPFSVIAQGAAGAAVPLATAAVNPIAGGALLFGSSLGEGVEMRKQADQRKEARLSDYLYTAPGAALQAVAPGKVLKGSVLPAAVLGAGGAAAMNIGTTVDTKRGVDPEAALDAALTGGATGAALGAGSRAIHGAVNTVRGRPSGEAPRADISDDARAELAQRLRTIADSTGARLDDSDPNSSTSAKRVLEKARDDLKVELKSLTATLSDQLRGDIPAQQALQGVDRAVAGKVGAADIQALRNAVGHTQEGQQLIRVVEQFDLVRDMRRGPLRAGISGKIADANPFNRDSPYGHGVRSLGKLGAIYGAVVDPVTTGSVGAAMGAGWLGARGLERAYGSLTGRGDPGRPVKAFVQRYGNREVAPAGEGLTSVERTRARQAEDRQRAVIETRQREADLREEARNRNVVSDPYDRRVYEQTGLKPDEAAYGVQRLYQAGVITRAEWDAYHNNPRGLMRGNVGNKIVDFLNDMANRGELKRDPAAQRSTGVEGLPPAVQTSAPHIWNPDAYRAAAEGNQRRITGTVQRIQNDARLPEGVRSVLAQHATNIGKANNAAEARSIRDQALAQIPQQHRQIANTLLSPLIRDKRHATPEKAEAVRPGQPKMEPMTREMSKRQMAMSPEARKAYHERLFKAYAKKIAEIERTKTIMPPKANFYRGGNEASVKEAETYKAEAGIAKPRMTEKFDIPKEYIAKVADWFDQAKHDPDNPKVKEAYDALARETLAQYEAMGKDLKVEPYLGKGEPYRNSGEMIDDVRNNRHLWFFRTENGFGQDGASIKHPMLAETPFKDVNGKPLLVNDVFRIVHDYFGHTQNGYQFGPVGEYNAFHEHARMFSDKAVPALAAETLAQNAWVNNGPHIRGKDIPMKERPFAEQKATVVPVELLKEDPHAAGMFVEAGAKPELIQKATESINAGGVSLDVFRGTDYGGTPHIAVSPFPERTQIPQGEATTDLVNSYVAANRDLLERNGFALGGWHDKGSGQTYLDVSVMVPKQYADEAVQLGRMTNQKAVFDLENFQEIPTGGDGTTANVAPLNERMALIDKVVSGERATDQEFSRQSDARRWMQEDFIKREGRVLDLAQPEDRARAAQRLAEEIVDAVEAGRDVGRGWYSENIDKMFTMLQRYFPELRPNKDGDWSPGRWAFNAALAITSNGIKVQRNLELAVQAYQYFRDHGLFPNLGEGDRAKNMSQHFSLANEIIKQYGLDTFIKVMNAEARVGDMRKAGIKVNGEAADQVLPLSVMFGPKIGGAFMANLSGNHRFATMDRWFMRTYSEVTGHHFRHRDPAEIEARRAEISGLLDRKAVKKLGYATKAEALADFDTLTYKLWDAAKKRKFQGLTELEKAARNYRAFTGPIDAPLGAKHRAALRDLMAETQQVLKKEFHQDLEISDIQAILWFLEKDRYIKRGLSDKFENENYADAAKALESSGQLTVAPPARSRMDRPSGDGRGRPGVRRMGGELDTSRHQASRREIGDALLKDEAFLNTIRGFGALNSKKE